MRWLLGSAALAAALAAGPANAQYGPTPLQAAAADYAGCVNERARKARQGGASADSAIASGFARCKSLRKRAMKETLSRFAEAGLPAPRAQAGTKILLDSADHTLAESLKQEFGGKPAGPPVAPK